MSLYRQLWMTVAICMALAFAASLGISAHGARAYLESQLAIKNADAANALALAMSQLPKDDGTLKLQASTLFEEGQYEYIRLFSHDGRMILEKSGVPGQEQGMLARILPIVPAAGVAEIHDGPVRFGRVEIASTRDIAYAQVRSIALQLLAGFLLAAAVTGALATWVLGRIRKPLAQVVEQAKAIAERRFITVAEPRTPELQHLAHAMNALVTRLRSMFAEEAARLDEVRRMANHDPLTGLANRAYFLARLAAILDAEKPASAGVLLLLRLRELAVLNRRIGREGADALLERTGAAFREMLAGSPEGEAGRLNGADFALALPGQTDLLECARRLRQAMLDARVQALAEAEEVFSVAAILVVPGEAAVHALARADAVLAKAEMETVNAVAVEESAQALAIPHNEAWRAMLTSALAHERIRLERFPTCRISGELVHQECFVRIDPENKGEWLPAGRFMSIVNRLELSAAFDLAVARKVLGLAASGEPHALNISPASLQLPDFSRAFFDLLDQSPAGLPWLSVEIAANGISGQAGAFSCLAAGLKERGCRIGIERFGRHLENIGDLHALGLDYFKIDAGFIEGIERSRGNQQFLKGLCTILRELGGLVIAEGVRTTDELHCLSSLGFDAATGPAIQHRP